jgi:DNA-binding NarL/FixJ family response regulator
VAQASNGREAIQQFREQRPDITLMDLQMPEMNGLDAMVAIRREFPEAKIIILTTYESDVQDAMKLGARAYLLKAHLDRDRLKTIRTVTPETRGSPKQDLSLCGVANENASTSGVADPEKQAFWPVGLCGLG